MIHPTSVPDPDHVGDLRIETIGGDDVVQVVLRGEADIATLEDLDAALEHLELDGAKLVHLDLTGLDFADVATVRRLAVFARQAKRTGHDVNACGASQILRKVAGVVDDQDELGIR